MQWSNPRTLHLKAERQRRLLNGEEFVVRLIPVSNCQNPLVYLVLCDILEVQEDLTIGFVDNHAGVCHVSSRPDYRGTTQELGR